MLKFFRIIRKRLLAESKFSRYLIYAIGEIILVVIGILIALGINTWNQDKKDRKLEQQYYCRLLEDVKQDLVNYNNSIDLLNEKIKSNNILLQRLLDDTMPLDSIAPYILQSIKYSIIDVSATTNAFEDIKSSGNLNIMKDVSVKDQLTSYYDALASTNFIVESNGRAITEIRFLQEEDLISTGWVKLLEGFKDMDTSIVVDLELLKSKINFTDEVRLRMTNDAVFYLGINSRNKQLIKLLEDDILSTLELLKGKCENELDQ